MSSYTADSRNVFTMRAASRRYRRFRPWLWPSLGGDRWLILWSPLSDDGVVRILGYRRKTRADRDVDRRLNMCCCHPDKPRGHTE